ncbi:hypothetical protein [Phaeobacter italicus]|uniref:hypothetical protein n=1 Tax=Phaeobacter italicus TaxID=481446 RepID=UPI001C944863|nr:hypothetical protein [Phaeobacter italicus]MBY6043630.1 hypothetical protein [Phaeobacter italicus]
MAKDCWDKGLIIGEVVGKVLTPIVIGGAALFFNDQTSQREQAARMTQIAVGILSEKPEYSPGDTQPDPLRNWAVAVLQQPGDTIPLDDAAADALRKQGLPRTFSAIESGLAMSSIGDSLCIFEKIGRGLSEGEAQRECEAERAARFEEIVRGFTESIEAIRPKSAP